MGDPNLFDVRDVLYAREEPEGDVEQIKKFEDRISSTDVPTNNVPNLDNTDLAEDVKEMILERAREKDMEDHAIITDSVKPARNPLLDKLQDLAKGESEVKPAVDTSMNRQVEAAMTDTNNTKVTESVKEVPTGNAVEEALKEKASADKRFNAAVEESMSAPLSEATSLDFLGDIRQAEMQFESDPLVQETIKDTQGVIKSKLDKLGIANVPLEAFFSAKTIDTLDKIDGYDVYQIFDVHIAMKRQLRKDLLLQYIREIKDSIKLGTAYSLNLKVSCVVAGPDGSNKTYDTILLNQNEIAYLCSAFRLYDVKLDADPEMREYMILRVG